MSENFESKNSKIWYLGLDIGTGSVGFCASDDKYNILKKGDKLQCGSRLFDTANTCKERRVFRCNGRRLERRKHRILFLQSIFEQEMNKFDPSFFNRLNRNKDGSMLQYQLFDDKDLEKEYYHKFPTIYRLKKFLLENDTSDLRLLYLALAHSIKYRGHFLQNNISVTSTDSNICDSIISLNEAIEKAILDSLQFQFKIDSISNIEKIFDDKTLANSDRKEKLYSYMINKDSYNTETYKLAKSIIDYILGYKIDIAKIWKEDYKDLTDDDKNGLKELKFSSDKFDEALQNAESILTDVQFEFILAMKAVYNDFVLYQVIGKNEFVCNAMVKKYEEHKNDLKLLQRFIKTYLPEQYNNIFRDKLDGKDITNSYSSYIGYSNSNSNKTIFHDPKNYDKKKWNKQYIKSSYDDFLNYIEKKIDTVDDSAKETYEYKALKKKIEAKTLCKKLNTVDNSTIPYQLNKHEIEAILNRQQKNFPFLLDADEYGTNIDKIISILTFKIPYYVGPLKKEGAENDHAWIKRNLGFENTKITPWNFNDVVNLDESGNSFITRMTNKCTYLRDEDVLPKCSITYQKYLVLNELNNLKLNGNRICQDLKMKIYNEIYLKQKNVTLKGINTYCINHNYIEKGDKIGNKDEEAKINFSLNSYLTLKDILQDKYNDELAEDIIELITVFSEEKDPVRNKLIKEHSDILSMEQINKICRLSFKGWGKFSSAFLKELSATDIKTGETCLSILDILMNTNNNLMEILNSNNYEVSEYGDKVIDQKNFVEACEEINKDLLCDKVNYSAVKDSTLSPSVKREVWQAIKVSKELVKINKCPPAKIFVEVDRENKPSQKVISRRKQIEKLYNELQEQEISNLEELKGQLSSLDDEKLRRDDLYFYFTQLGKDMYTGKGIDLDLLLSKNNSSWDIDHIYPQSVVKDDSNSNRVLASKYINQEVKKNIYPLPESIRKDPVVISLWNKLLKEGLISKTKYNRLTSSIPLTDNQIQGFINWQLVETNQAEKETIRLLKMLYSDSTVVFSKASHVSEFRKKYDIIKSRNINDIHHGHDAYLNIVVGNVWYVKYSGNEFWKNKTVNEDDAIDKLFEYNIEGAWDSNYIGKVKNYILDNKNYLNKYVVTKKKEYIKGKFYDQTIYCRGNAKASIPLHDGWDVDKFGGYYSKVYSYNCLIGDKDNGKTRYKGPYSVSVKDADSKDVLSRILSEHELHDLSNPFMIKLPINTIFEIDGTRYIMRSGVDTKGHIQFSVTTQWQPDQNIAIYVKDIFKFLQKKFDKKNPPKDEIFHLGTRENKIIDIDKRKNLELYDAIFKQLEKPIYSEYGIYKAIQKGVISRNAFIELTTYEQVLQLEQLLNNITSNGSNCECRQIKGKLYNCKYIPSVNELSKHSVYLIDQSVTGLYERRIPIFEKKV